MMNKKCFASLLILFSFVSFQAQIHVVDSLKQLVKKATHDTTKCQLLGLMTEAEYDINVWPLYNEQAKQLAENNLKKKLSPAEKSAFLKSLASSYNNVGFLYSETGDFKKALEWYHKSLEINKEIQDKHGIATIINNIGYLHYHQNDYSTALTYYFKSLKLMREIGNKDGIGFTLKGIGTVYQHQGDFSKALEYYFQSLKVREEIGDKLGLSFIYNNIGYIHEEQENYSEALEAYEKSAKYAEEMNSEIDAAMSYENMAHVYQVQGFYQKALDIHLKMEPVFQKQPNKKDLATNYLNIGYNYFHLKDTETALSYYNKSLDLATQVGDRERIASALYCLSEVYHMTGRITEALPLAERAMKLAKELNELETIRDEASLLYHIYKKQNKTAQALEMYELYNLLSDSVKNEKYRKLSLQKQYQHDYEKKEIEMKAMSKAEKDKIQFEADEKHKRQNMIILSVCIGLGLVLVFSIFIFRGLQKNKKANKIISSQKKEVEIQKHLVEEKQKEIVDSITYAKRLQEAILPPQQFVDAYLPDNFILYKPKDLVAGDFYWAEHRGNLFFIAAADSTGHGVPGAMVSVVCSNALNRSLNEFNLTETGKLLDKTRELVMETFSKSVNEVKDGMDISLMCFDKINRRVFWSGANNPLWYIGNAMAGVDEKGFGEIKADKQPIGKAENPKPFTTHQLDYISGTTFYLFTDGFADQFGGEKGKKFKYKQLMDLLTSIKNEPLALQKQILDDAFLKWKGDLEQVDDVTIIGVRI